MIVGNDVAQHENSGNRDREMKATRDLKSKVGVIHEIYICKITQGYATFRLF